ncbi:MAG: four helix bundle protein [Flavobacteriales bacterium]|nr:MAG: four helix bundle protein [Flavobacteriales bacterium]
MSPKTQELLDRTFRFGVGILKFLATLPHTPIYLDAKRQLGKAATSIGANYEEAQGAVSKKDFSNKIGIVYKESRESHFWLRVLQAIYNDVKYEKEFNRFLIEAIEFKKIFSSIKLTADSKTIKSP